MNEMQSLSPITHCIIRDDIFPVPGYRVWGEPQRRGWNPRERLDCYWAGSRNHIQKKPPCPAMPRRGPDAGVHPIPAIFMIPVWTLQIPVRFSKAGFLLNEIILRIIHQGNLEQMQTTSAERQYMAGGYLSIKKWELRLSCFTSFLLLSYPVTSLTSLQAPRF